MGQLLNGVGNLVMQDKARTKVLSAIFKLVFPGKIGLEYQVPETRGKVWSKENFPLAEEDQVRGKLKQTGYIQVHWT